MSFGFGTAKTGTFGCGPGPGGFAAAPGAAFGGAPTGGTFG